MAAPKNNQFWKQRATHGREKIFKTPVDLWQAACEYFQWCDENPWYKYEAAKAGDHFGENVTVPVERPYTITGLCIFLDCDVETFLNYGKAEAYKDFFGVVSKIRDVIYTQKFEGAAVGAFNASIIIRDLGLRDKQEHEHSGELNTGTTIIVNSEDQKSKLDKELNRLNERQKDN